VLAVLRRSRRNREVWDRAAAGFNDLVNQLTDDDWVKPTPCKDWDIRRLVGHMACTMRMPVALAQGIPLGVPAGPDASPVTTPQGDDLFFNTEFFATVQQIVEAMDGDPKGTWVSAYASQRLALDNLDLDAPALGTQFGILTVDEWLGICFWDPVVHTWDLGQAAGISGLPADDLCAAALELLTQVETTANMRLPFVFAEALEPASDTPKDQLIALVGRSATWR